jgi:hypothetical protein
VQNPTKVMFSFLLDFPDMIMLYNAAIRIVTGIKNSTTVDLIDSILKTERNNAKVCPRVKKDTKISIFFHDLNS